MRIDSPNIGWHGLKDRILSIDKDIEEMMRKAAIFGENGQIDNSSRCL